MLDRKPFDKSDVIAFRQKDGSDGNELSKSRKYGNTINNKKKERGREDKTQETKQANI